MASSANAQTATSLQLQHEAQILATRPWNSFLDHLVSRLLDLDSCFMLSTSPAWRVLQKPNISRSLQHHRRTAGIFRPGLYPQKRMCASLASSPSSTALSAGHDARRGPLQANSAEVHSYVRSLIFLQTASQTYCRFENGTVVVRYHCSPKGMTLLT